MDFPKEKSEPPIQNSKFHVVKDFVIFNFIIVMQLQSSLVYRSVYFPFALCLGTLNITSIDYSYPSQIERLSISMPFVPYHTSAGQSKIVK